MNKQKSARSISPLSFLSVGIVLIMLVPINLVMETKMLLLERIFKGGGWVEIAGLAVYAYFLSRRLLSADSISTVRSRYWRLFSAVFFLQLILGIFVSSLFLMTGELHLPVPAMIIGGSIYRNEVSIMLFIFAGTIVLTGPGWCSHLCYIGAVDDFFSKRRTAAETDRPLSYTWRYLGIGLTVAAAFLFRAYFRDTAFPLWTAVGFGIGGILVSIFASRPRGQMVHCTAYCPVGGITTLLGKLYPVRIKINTEACIECGKGRKACRYGALSPDHIASGTAGWNCTLCGDCLSACPTGALSMQPLFSSKNFWPYYAALNVGLHAVFLGLARI